MQTVNKANARYEGLGRTGKGHVATASKVLDAPFGFGTRFEGEAGTNPEELVAAAHAACFTMATSFQLAGAGHEEGQLHTDCAVTLVRDEDGGFTVTKSALSLKAKVPGVDAATFEQLARTAKEQCPISKLYDCEITLEIDFEG